MLRKLLKYEMSAISRIMLPITACVLLCGVLAGGFIAAAFSLQLDTDTSAFSVFKNIFVFSLWGAVAMIIMAISAVTIVSFFVVVYRYYKSMYTDEAYLTFTLPVKSGRIVTSKFIVSYAWVLISTLAAIISMAFIVLTYVYMASGGLEPIFEFLSEMREMFLSMYSTEYFIVIAVMLGLMALVSPALTVLFAYASVSIGCQLASKHKVLASIGVYFLLSTCSSMVYYTVSFITQVLVRFDMSVTSSLIVLGVNVAVSVVLCIVLGLIVRRLADRRNSFA